jgi:3-deoxy-D-manno-octulosonic-acid transferase
MIEPAAYGAAVVFGPHVWNFRETAAQLVQARAAIQVPDATALEQEVQRLLCEPVLREYVGRAAQAFVRSQQGATGRTIAELSRLLERGHSRAWAA